MRIRITHKRAVKCDQGMIAPGELGDLPDELARIVIDRGHGEEVKRRRGRPPKKKPAGK